MAEKGREESIDERLRTFAASHACVHEVYRKDEGSIHAYLFFPKSDGDDAIEFSFDTAFLVELSELHQQIRSHDDPKILLKMETDDKQRNGTLIYRRS